MSQGAMTFGETGTEGVLPSLFLVTAVWYRDSELTFSTHFQVLV